MSKKRVNKAVSALVAAALTVFSLSLMTTSFPGGAHAQTADGKSGKSKAALSEPTTREAVRELLSELDDTQVRALLLERMTKEVDRRAAERVGQEARGLGEIARDRFRALGRYIGDAITKLPQVPAGTVKAWSNFMDQRGDRSVMLFLLSLLACLLLGTAAAFGGQRTASHLERGVAETIEPDNLAAEAKIASLTLLVRLLPIAAFLAAAGISNLVFNGSFPVDYNVTGRIISAAAWTGLTVAVARFALTPTLPEWRHCPVASRATDFLVWRIGLTAALFNFGLGFALWLDRFGSAFSETRFGFWIGVAVHVLLIATIWQARRGISSIVAGSAEIAQSGKSPWSSWWPWMMIVLLVGHWLLISTMVATDSAPQNLLTAVAITLAVLVGLPVINHAIRAGVRRALSLSPDASPALHAAEETTQVGVMRITRVIVAVAVSIGLLWLWGLDLVAVAQKGMGTRFASSLINMLLILGLAYGLWELVRIVTERQIAIERASLGLDLDAGADQAMEGEGGGAGARLGTILPLIRIGLQIAIVILAILAILGELGINVLPILAGAGVVGLAIGFGAQTLVKDIISGIFFLVDDAFRKGEYIDIGSVKGTVEKISLRSMQLRHHNGPLNTIPFGDIRHVTNFSRDWVIMKLTLRLTYDTDAEKVRKLIKKLGQEMAEEENLKPLFLQPLKSQGVIEMQDSAQIMRVKFMTRPGDQWGLRRVVFARIRELFEKEGIRFASREVVVRVENPSDTHDMTREERTALGAASARALELADASTGNSGKN
jgi:small-conductance mechanosensitive channel